MAFADDLKSFLEERLKAFDPTIDLSANSPAQIQVIEPTLRRFEEDPFSTDIPTFIKDRLIQEFPDLAADGGGMLQDALAKPLQLMLEPFKREIELIKIGQSASNAALMSEDEATALGANWFEDRNEGGSATGSVRLYYAAPTTSRVSTDKRLFTNSGLSFFPSQNYYISAQQMLFNRQGNLYFLDIVVEAETAGDEYNVARNEIVGIEEVPGVIKVANLSDFGDGAPRETNEEYLGRFPQSLTERSLVTKRGVLARTPTLFESVRALQIVGAGDLGMNRDIITGTGEGFLHLAGKGTVYGDWLFTSEIIFKDDGEDDAIIPQPGDKIRFHDTTLTPTTVVEAIVSEILSTSTDLFIFLLDKALFSPSLAVVGRFALFKPGYITISNVPGGISTGFTVPDNTVHVGGHTDVFARPVDDARLTGTLQSVTDQTPLVAITNLTVPAANDNLVQSTTNGADTAIDFVAAGVVSGDVLVIETGTGFAGTYRVIELAGVNGLRVDALFDAATAGGTYLRARIVRNIAVDLVEPRIPKLPFKPGPVSDLRTTVGLNEFRFDVIDIQNFGAKIGDTVEVIDGPDAGPFIIVDFGISGTVFVDKVATSTGANLRYEVYTALPGLDLPLVRIRSLEVLDSTNQGTGIAVPYGDAVDIRTMCDLEGAGKEVITYDKQLIVFPDMSGIWDALGDDPISGGSINNTTDARYSQQTEIADGWVRTVTFHASNPITSAEINLPPFLWNGRRDKLLALTTRKDYDFPGAGDHRTSDLAEAKAGDSFTIYDGPNQGKYIIKDIRVLDMWGKLDQGHRKLALIQCDPPLKVDPIRTGINFIDDTIVAPWSAASYVSLLDTATIWDEVTSFYYAQFLTYLRTALISTNVTFATVDELKTFFDPLVRTSFDVGPSAKGDLRLYFLEPVSCEFYFGDNPTIFESAVGGEKVLRLDPFLEPAQIFPESENGTAPTAWNRNLGLRYPVDSYVFLTSGSSLPKRGIQVGDVVEFCSAINDLPARKDMTSSWLCLTQTGSNIVQLVLPPSTELDNYTVITPGHLLFLDSGPDLGAYTVTKIIEQNWLSNPPVVKVQLDRSMTHTTENMPALSTATVPPPQCDFSSGLPAYVGTGTLTFPMNIATKKVHFSSSSDGGGSYTPYEYTFAGPDPYNAASDVVTELNADAGFSALFFAQTDGSKIYITHLTAGPLTRVRVETPSSNSAYGDLTFTIGNVGSGIRGGGAVSATKRVYGSGVNQILINDWVSLYAAKSTQILTNGDDEAYLGTFKVVAIGTSDAVYWGPYNLWIELDRTADFPADAEVRWVRHSAPDTTPITTSGGGTEISSQFVRARLYNFVTRKITVTDIPWGSSPHPLLDTSEYQLELTSPGLIEVGEVNYAHLAPYRILRDGLKKISSTTMSENREGALYYIDLPVIGYGPGEEMNVGTDEGFVIAGTSKIAGYSLHVEDENFVFSSKEQVSIRLPNSVLPVGSTPDLENEFSLAGQNIQASYDNAPLIDDLQRFFDSPLDRVATANMLCRHFLPAYVLLDASYSGGAAVDEVAADIISYLNNINPDVAEIRSDLVQDIFKRRGATKVNLPLVLIALVHGTDRRIRGMRSETAIGISDLPVFKGTFQQTYFISGPDTSKETTRPDGEQIYLTRF